MRPPVWQLVRDAAQQLGGELSYAAIKQHVWAKYPEVNSSTLTCQIIICSVNHPSRIHYPENKKPRICTSQYDFLFNIGRGKVTSYDPDKHGQWEIVEQEGALSVRLLQEATVDPIFPAELGDEQGGSFALESHLRDYLAKHLPTMDGCTEPLRLFVSEDGRDGVEFQTEVGPIDILATSNIGDLYVFELKLGRGADAALGQILRYMGWVEQHLCNGKRVFGVVVAAQISTKLRYAATQVLNVRLMEYELKVSLKSAHLQRDV
ncbi:MAG: DUF91 domain-containing protein [Sterolibacteriaceae bacterium]|nr:DUF91 domain-containing protein [Sterolibacteriaceae bacterium]MBK9086787.1 DUF91 domain-containing protein [Sterolibacteriaceae bacterium]